MTESSPGSVPLLDLFGQPPLESCSSTQEVCRELARQGMPEGTCVRARRQTAGRGRGERLWPSPTGGGLYLSFLLRPRIERSLWPYLTALVALATAEALEDLAVSSKPGGWRAWIKWPNDLHGRRGKLGGILAEVAGDAVVIGLGINLAMKEEDLPQVLRRHASSLLLEGFDPVPAVEAAATALNFRLGPLYARFQAGDRAFLQEGLRRRFFLRGAQVALAVAGSRVEGTALDAGPLGELLLQTAEGTRTLISGEVIWWRRAEAQGGFDAGPPLR